MKATEIVIFTDFEHKILLKDNRCKNCIEGRELTATVVT